MESYHQAMSTSQLRREIKKEIDRLPPGKLGSVLDYLQFLGRPSLSQQVAEGEKAIRAGKGVNWRKVRKDV